MAARQMARTADERSEGSRRRQRAERSFMEAMPEYTRQSLPSVADLGQFFNVSGQYV